MSRADPVDRARVREGVLFVVGLAVMLVVDAKGFGVEDGDPYTLWVDIIVGLLMQWSGLLVWRRRGTGPLGPWLYLAGLLWFVGSGMPAPVEWMTFPFRGWYEPLLVAVVLTYPTGRFVTRVDRILVLTLVIAYAARTAARAFFLDLGLHFFGEPEPPPTLIVYNEQLWMTVENIVMVTSALVGIAVAIRCVQHWRRATGPARRTLTPVLASGLAIAPMLGWSALSTPTNVFGLPIPDPMWMLWFQLLLRGFVPVAVLVGIVRLQSARGSLTDLLLDLDRGVTVGRQLEEVMRVQLHDPSLRLLFVRPDQGIADADNRPAALEAPPGRVLTRIHDASGRPIAYIDHDEALIEDPDFVLAAGAAARLPRERAPAGGGPGTAGRGARAERAARRRIRCGAATNGT